jgi:imidazolonepropionase-like amidohydrolase
MTGSSRTDGTPRIQPGCYADILIVNGDPLVDINELAQGGRRLTAIMKGGQFHKRLS